MVGASHAVLGQSGAASHVDGRRAGSRRCQWPNDCPGQFRSGRGDNHAIEWGCGTHWQGTARGGRERRATDRKLQGPDRKKRDKVAAAEMPPPTREKKRRRAVETSTQDRKEKRS